MLACVPSRSNLPHGRTGLFSRGKPFPGEFRRGLGAAAINGALLAMGGAEGFNHTVRKVEAYLPEPIAPCATPP